MRLGRVENMACVAGTTVGAGSGLIGRSFGCGENEKQRKSGLGALVSVVNVRPRDLSKVQKRGVLKFETSCLARSVGDVLKERTSTGGIGAAERSCEFLATVTANSYLDRVSTSRNGDVSSATLESWLQNSMFDIVKRLPEAPFLQYLFTKSNDKPIVWQRVSEELFEKPERWNLATESLSNCAPDGIILVKRLDHEALAGDNCVNTVNAQGQDPSICVQEEGSTDVWGVLVQGCRDPVNACYILKTTRVASSGGILTHFCLKRAKCFGPSLKCQLENAWLV